MLFTYLKVQWPKMNRVWMLLGRCIINKIMCQTLTVEATQSVCGWLVETHPPGTSKTSKVQFVITLMSFVWFIVFLTCLNGFKCLQRVSFYSLPFQLKDDSETPQILWKVFIHFKNSPTLFNSFNPKSIEETCAISKDYVYVYQRTLKNISFHVNRNENKVAKS